MPPFFTPTGNAQWDQNMSALSGIFPDQSKQAMGYYYGTEARKAQLESNKMIGQGNMEARLGQYTFANDPEYNTPRPASPTWTTPSNVPGAFPIIAPPSNLPMSGTNAPPLSSAVVGQPPAGGGVPQPTMTPPQAANTMADMLQNNPNSPMQGGTAPALSSPAPNAGAPANTPTATGSNGSQAPDAASATVHPNSVASGGGGTIYAPPAAANGSHAPMSPGVNLGTYVAMAVMAGHDAASAQAMGQATIAAAVQQGRITPSQAHELLAGTGQPGPLNADIQGRTAITTTGMQVAGENYRAGLPVQSIIDPNDPTKTQWVHLDDPRFRTGIQAGNPLATPNLTQPTQVVPPLDPNAPPGTPPNEPITVPAFKAGQPMAPPAPGTPQPPATYQPTIANTLVTQGGTYELFLDPSGKLTKMPQAQGLAQHLTPVQAGTDPANAAAIAQIRNEPDPVKQQKLIDTFNATPTVPKVVDATENAKNQFLIDKQLQLLMPQPTKSPLNPQMLTNRNPAGASPELGRVLSDLSDQYFSSGPTGIRGNRIQATNAALQQLVSQQYIYPNQDRSSNVFSDADTSVNKPVFDKAGNALPPAPHFQVHIYKPGTDQAYGPGQAPRVMKPPEPLGAVVTTPQPGGPPIARAPPNTPDGPQMYQGRPAMVRSGLVYWQ